MKIIIVREKKSFNKLVQDMFLLSLLQSLNSMSEKTVENKEKYAKNELDEFIRTQYGEIPDLSDPDVDDVEIPDLSDLDILDEKRKALFKELDEVNLKLDNILSNFKK